MRRECPSCRKTMGRLRTDRTQRSDQAWYQLSRPRFYCPECGVEVRPIVQPMGYLLQGLGLAVAVVAVSLWGFYGATWRVWIAVAVACGMLVLMAILGWLAQRGGFRYALATDSLRTNSGRGR
jgi:hypothetical protein